MAVPTWRVVINDGHADTIPGALGPRLRVKEADITKAVAKRLVTLSGEGLTYEAKRQEGADLAGLLEALRHNPPLYLVSLHMNAPSTKLSQCQCYYYLQDHDHARRKNSLTLARSIAASAKDPKRGFVPGSEVLPAPYRRNGTWFTPGILRGTARLAVTLVEIDFISNAGVEKKCVTPEWQSAVAAALDRGIRSAIEQIGG